MDEGGTTTKTGIYCRGCDYDLRESAGRCPECGRPFEPANPKTYFTSPRSWRVRRWVRRIVLLILLVTLPSGMGLGWLWRGWKAEQGHIAALKQTGLMTSAYGPIYPWLPQILPSRWRFLADRADTLCDPVSSLWTAETLPQEAVTHIAHLTRLRGLALWGMRATDQDVHRLRGLSRMETIILSGPGITDQALADLAQMTRLEVLVLFNTSIAGPGLSHLANMPRLKHLTLDAVPIDDEGLKSLRGMTELETLVFDGTAITDAGLEHLKGLSKLKRLALGRFRISLAAERRLRTALPQLIIEGKPRRPDSPAPATAPAANIAR